MSKKIVLFLCTGNSCRSQMAEGLLRNFGGDTYDVYSAGSEPAVQVNPLAIEIMKEIGLNISDKYPKHIKKFLNHDFDYVITLCDNARKACPIFPKKTVNIHWNIEDPADAVGIREEQLKVFRKIRDILYERISEFINTIKVNLYINEQSFNLF
ncbi:MAG: arsenate reductase ArsC [Candidatus Helarchaeota archaeon]